MKRAFLSALVFGSAFILNSGLAQAISLDFAPTTQSVTLGGPTTVALRISGLGDLTAPSLGVFDLSVGFDPTILSFSSVAYGDPLLGDQLDLFGLGGFTVTTSGAGVVNLFELSFDSAADLNALQAGEFTLATLTFYTLSTGTSPLTFAVNALGDAEGAALTATLGAGSVAVASAAVPEPGTLLLLGSGLAWMFFIGYRKVQAMGDNLERY